MPLIKLLARAIATTKKRVTTTTKKRVTTTTKKRVTTTTKKRVTTTTKKRVTTTNRNPTTTTTTVSYGTVDTTGNVPSGGRVYGLKTTGFLYDKQPVIVENLILGSKSADFDAPYGKFYYNTFPYALKVVILYGNIFVPSYATLNVPGDSYLLVDRTHVNFRAITVTDFTFDILNQYLVVESTGGNDFAGVLEFRRDDRYYFWFRNTPAHTDVTTSVFVATSIGQQFEINASNGGSPTTFFCINKLDKDIKLQVLSNTPGRSILPSNVLKATNTGNNIYTVVAG